MTQSTFYDEIQADPIDIPRAAMQFARAIAYPELNVAAEMTHIDTLADSARSFISPNQSIIEQAEGLSDYLFIQQRFRGNTHEYDDPRNSYLNQVLERRLGIPISLSVLYMSVAERLGIPALGIGLPGHFIVGISTSIEDFFIDPFHGGSRLSREDCGLLVRESTGYDGPLQDKWLKPIAGRALLTRMLNNLRNAYFRREAWEHAQAVVEHLRMLQPDMPELLRDTGWIYHRRGSLRKAVQYYEQYLSRMPDAPDAETVRSHLAAAGRSLALLN